MLNRGEIFPLLLGAIILFFAKYKITDNEENYLSRENGTQIKGLLSLFVFFSHIALFFEGNIVYPILRRLGTMSVGVFFFLSGYGLMKQNMMKDDYSKGFVKKRVLKIAVPYLFVTIVYWLFFLLIDEKISVTDVLLRFFNGDPVASYSWYVIEIMVLYMFFYFFIRLWKNNRLAIIVSEISLYLLLWVFFNTNGYGSHWICSTHMFTIGIVWAAYENQIVDILKGNYYYVLGIVVPVLFITTSGINNTFTKEIMFLLIIIMFSFKLDIKSLILQFLGRISMETYLIHGLIIKVVRRYLWVEDEMVMIAVVFVCTVLCSFLLNKGFNHFYKRVGLR